jgi:hypothetical protein
VRKQGGLHSCLRPTNTAQPQKNATAWHRKLKSEADRLACLNLASIWLEAASRSDEVTPEQIAEAEKLARQQKIEHEVPQTKSISKWRRLVGLFR